MVDCGLYSCGARTGGAMGVRTAAERARSDPDTFVWMGLYEPDHAELAHAAQEFRLHPLAVEDAVKAHQRPKLEVYGDTLFVVLKTLRYVEATSSVETGEVMLFIGPHFAITVRHGPGNPLARVRQRLEAQDSLLRCGPAAVLYVVCDAVVDAYGEVAAAVEDDLEQLEARVFSPDRANQAEWIYRLKREVLEVRHAVLPLAEPVRAFADGDLPALLPATQPFFRDVADHVYRVSEQVESYDRLLTDVLSAHLTQVSVRQNEDMRRISAWVAIAAVPTTIAGIYGMNFRNLPGLDSPYGSPVVLAALGVVCLVLYVAFRRSGWL